MKQVDEIIEYCNKIVDCEKCVFHFRANNIEECSCGVNYPRTWKGENKLQKEYLLTLEEDFQKAKEYLLLINENNKIKEDLQKAKDEVQYYKEIYFGGNVTNGKE